MNQKIFKIKKLVRIQDELLIVIKNFGTESIEDLIKLLFEENYIQNFKNELLTKYLLIKRLSHPINYKVILWKPNTTPQNKKILHKNKIIEDSMICENGQLLDCYDLCRTSKSFQTKVYGVKICLHDFINKKTYLIACLVDDILTTSLDNNYIDNCISNLNDNKPKDNDLNSDQWEKFIECLTVKELLVYSSAELSQRFISIINQLLLIKQKTVVQVVKEFLNSELYTQRTTLINLLIKFNEEDFQYLAYLLYDLLSNENNGNVDTLEQTLLYDSLPWNTKKFFKSAMKQTIQYTNNLCNYDSDKIPLEQQICLMKANDLVKEKAIVKLKEIKAKSEDSGSKARQYLDGLLKIPFSIVREEPILKLVNTNYNLFNETKKTILENKDFEFNVHIPNKSNYTNIEIQNYISKIKKDYIPNLISNSILLLESLIKKLKKDDLIVLTNSINLLIKNSKLNFNKINYSNRKSIEIQNDLLDFLSKQSDNSNIVNNIWNIFEKIIPSNNPNNYIKIINKNIYNIDENIKNNS